MPPGASFISRMMGLGNFIDHRQQQQEARRAHNALYNSRAGLSSPFHPANRAQHGMLVPHLRAGHRVAPPWERGPIPYQRHLAPLEQAIIPCRGPRHVRCWPPQRPYPPGIYRRRRHEPIEEWELQFDETDDNNFFDDHLSDSGESFWSDDASFSDLEFAPTLHMREARGSCFERRRPVLGHRRQRRQRYGDGARRRAHQRQVSRGLYGRGRGIDRVYGRYPRDSFRTGDYGGSAYESESSVLFADD